MGAQREDTAVRLATFVLSSSYLLFAHNGCVSKSVSFEHFRNEMIYLGVGTLGFWDHAVLFRNKTRTVLFPAGSPTTVPATYGGKVSRYDLL